ncbi:MAG: hypothetical protein ABI550_03905, partial [Ignavibacteriaceae bacterium]
MDRNGRRDGLFYIDELTGFVKQLNPARFFTNYIYEDKSGMLWDCTASGGLFLYSKDRKSFSYYVNDPDDSSSVSFTTVVDLYEDKIGIIWLACNSGLNKYDPSTKKFSLFKRDNTSAYAAFGILSDSHGKLWLSNPGGITKYDPESNLFRNWDISYGLPLNGFGTLSGFKDKNGEMYFGGRYGLYCFHPDSIKDNSFIP